MTARANLSGAAPAKDQDASLGFVAPSGASTTSVRLKPGNFTSIDGLAFVMSSPAMIPERPGVLALAGVAAACAARRYPARR